jgi:ribonuclease BN (tRNA processing enzyme)
LLVIGGHPYVIDCGLGVTRALVEAGMALPELRNIVITHLHSDHVLEMGPLIHTAWTAGLKEKILVHGPAGTRAVWQGFLASLSYDIAIRIEDEGRPDLAAMVEVLEYADGHVFTDARVSFSALRVEHPPVTECFALRFDHGAGSVVFSADTTYFPPLAAFARGADILVHEAIYEPGVDRLVARVGNGARLKQHLLASHTLAEDVGRPAPPMTKLVPLRSGSRTVFWVYGCAVFCTQPSQPPPVLAVKPLKTNLSSDMCPFAQK